MNNVISISYDKSPKDLTALTSFEFNKYKNVLQMKVGYVGSNAEEIIKIVTEQGYIDEIKAKVRADAIDEFVEKADAEIYQDFNRTDVGEYTITDVALTIRRVAEQLKEKNDNRTI